MPPEYQNTAKMKKILSFCIAVLLVSACGSHNNNKVGKPISLPEPTETQHIVYETDTIRIVSDNDQKLMVQPKFDKLKGFEAVADENEYLSFEKVIGNCLVASSGTGNLRDLAAYDIHNGEKVLAIANYDGGIESDKEGGFVFKVRNVDYALQWDEATSTWANEDNIPEAYRGELLETAKTELGCELFNGISIGLFIEKHFDIANREVKDTGAFYWKYVE